METVENLIVRDDGWWEDPDSITDEDYYRDMPDYLEGDEIKLN